MGHFVEVGLFFGRARLARPVPFDLDALNLMGKDYLAAQKEFIVVPALVSTCREGAAEGDTKREQWGEARSANPNHDFETRRNRRWCLTYLRRDDGSRKCSAVAERRQTWTDETIWKGKGERE